MTYRITIHNEDEITTIIASNKDKIIQALADHIRFVIGDEVYIDGEMI